MIYSQAYEMHADRHKNGNLEAKHGLKAYLHPMCTLEDPA